MIAAVLLAPLVAVQVSQLLERQREERRRRFDLFRQLMSTRAAPLAGSHVEALNLIDLEFYGVSEITDAWKSYLDHLNDTSSSDAEGRPSLEWGNRSKELLAELLYIMGRHVGYRFDRVHLKRAAYYPRGYGDYESDHAIIRRQLVEILSGEAPLPIELAPPRDEARAKEQAEMLERWKGFLEGKATLQFRNVEKSSAPPGEKAPSE